ncbi:hypothetical protein K8R78_02535 [bacterium]|nr:hypothetical protein [bacterium]
MKTRSLLLLTLLAIGAIAAPTVVYQPTLPVDYPLTAEEVAGEFASGLGNPEGWRFNEPTLFGELLAPLSGPRGLGELITYAAQSEASDVAMLRFSETEEGGFAFALRWQDNHLSGSCLYVDDLSDFDWSELGRGLSIDKLEVGDGEPHSYTGLRWLAELDPGLALIAALDWLAEEPDSYTAAAQVIRLAGRVCGQISPVGDVAALRGTQQALQVLVSLSAEILRQSRDKIEGEPLLRLLYETGNVAESAWKALRLTLPFRGLGDSLASLETVTREGRELSFAFRQQALNGYAECIRVAHAQGLLGSTWLMLAHVSSEVIESIH